MPALPTIKLVDLATPAAVGTDRADWEASVLPEANLGAVIADKYLVESVLGRGGMGLVLAAQHMELGHRVAIKVLLHYRDDAAAAVRFLREAQTCARLKSDHIARVFDIGRLPGGAPFIVMEYLVGQDLATVVASGPIPVADAVRYVVDACTAVAEAHAAGIVHRDLKPANLFLTTRPRGGPLVKVLDFGISKVLIEQKPEGAAEGLQAGDGRERTPSLTDTGALIGSPFYVSPEQIRASHSVDARADIWSLGVILYELLAGNPPFKASTLPALAVAIENDIPPPLSESRSDLPPGLEAVTARCLQKDPSARFPSVEALAQALAPFLSPEPPIPVDGDSRRIVATDRPAVPVELQTRARSSWSTLVVAGLALTVVAGVALGLSSRTRAPTGGRTRHDLATETPVARSAGAPPSAAAVRPPEPSPTAASAVSAQNNKRTDSISASENPRRRRSVARKQPSVQPTRDDASSAAQPAAAAGPLDTPD